MFCYILSYYYQIQVSQKMDSSSIRLFKEVKVNLLYRRSSGVKDPEAETLSMQIPVNVITYVSDKVSLVF